MNVAIALVMTSFPRSESSNDDEQAFTVDPALVLESIGGNFRAGYVPVPGVGVFVTVATGEQLVCRMTFDQFRDLLLDSCSQEFNPGDINRWTDAVTAAIAREASL